MVTISTFTIASTAPLPTKIYIEQQEFSLRDFFLVSTLILNSFALILSLRNRRKDLRNSHIDDFWLRKIIVPEALKEIDDYCIKCKKLWRKVKAAGCIKDYSSTADKLNDLTDTLISKLSRYADIERKSSIGPMINTVVGIADEFSGILIEILHSIDRHSSESSPHEALTLHIDEAIIATDRFQKHVIETIARHHRKAAS